MYSIDRHFRVHPKTQELLPELAGIALADLPNNAYFVQLSETYVVLATNEIVDNLDNAGVLSKLLECLHPEWYVDYVSIDRQNDVSFIRQPHWDFFVFRIFSQCLADWCGHGYVI